jgi:hypothetical protein
LTIEPVQNKTRSAFAKLYPDIVGASQQLCIDAERASSIHAMHALLTSFYASFMYDKVVDTVDAFGESAVCSFGKLWLLICYCCGTSGASVSRKASIQKVSTTTKQLSLSLPRAARFCY